MDFRFSWKALVIAISLALPATAQAKPKEKPTMFQVVDTFLNGKPTPTAALKVNVMDENAQPVSGAVVKLKRRETGENKTLHTTDAFGFTENSSAKNDYELEISKPGYAAITKYIYLDKGITERVVLKKLEPQNVAEHMDRMPASEPIEEVDLP